MNTFRICTLVAVLLITYMQSVWPKPGRILVLATSMKSSIPALNTQETRKLFLGVPLLKEGVRLKPLLNLSDQVEYEVFLQNVAYMSANTYENQTLSVVFRLGGTRPESYNDLPALIKVLQQKPDAVTFLWEDQVTAVTGLKIVNVLWRGSPE
jgi:hypothetical protein